MIPIALMAALSLQVQDVGQYGWIVRQGHDTVSVEQVTRRPGELRADVLVPGRARLKVVASTTPHGCVTAASVSVFPWGSAPEATPVQRVEVRLDGDSVRVAAQARDVSRTGVVPAPDARFVLAGDSYAASVLVVECALASGADSVDLPVVAFPNLRTRTVGVRRHGTLVTVVGDDSARVWLDESALPVHVEVGRGGVVLERVALAQIVTAGVDASDYSAPPGAEYTAENVTVPVERGVVLAGTLTMPRNASEQMPAVVTVSGSGAQNRDSFAAIAGGWRPFRQIAEELAAHRIAVLRFDDRGVGASTGDYATGTEVTAAADVRAAVAYLRRRPDIDPGRIAVLGHSEGARVAMLVGAGDSALAGLVLLSGAADTRAAMRAQALWLAEHTSGAPAISRDSLIARVDREVDSLAVTARREVYRWDAARVAQRIRVPVAVFHGETDRQVPADQADSLGVVFKRSGNADVTVQVFPGVNHLLVHDAVGDFLQYERLESADVAEEVLTALGNWLAARLGRR
jgi:dienelactone hydrolase